MPELNFDAPDISAFKYDPFNPFYLLAKLIFYTVRKARKSKGKNCNRNFEHLEE